jgi:hypothetical protein
MIVDRASATTTMKPIVNGGCMPAINNMSIELFYALNIEMLPLCSSTDHTIDLKTANQWPFW